MQFEKYFQFERDIQVKWTKYRYFNSFRAIKNKMYWLV